MIQQTPKPRADLPLLAVLVVVAVSLRGWQLSHTEVASRDSIGYIRIAWQLEHHPWGEVMRNAPQHPGYPLALLGMSLPVRSFARGDLATVMQLSAQLASSLASVLLLFPMYYLGRELFNRRVGFWAALFFQCLPTSGRGMADGLSEPFFLLAAASALAFAFYALRRGSAVGFALCGLSGGLAYLTRPEGALLVGFTGLVLLACQAVPRWRHPWRRVLFGGVSLAAGAVAVGGPYAWTIGHWTVKHSAQELWNHAGSEPTGEPQTRGHAEPGSPLWAVWWPDSKTPPAARVWWGFETLIAVLGKGFFYVYWVPALLGLWWFRDRFRVVPGTWVLVLLWAALGYLLYRVAQLMGYLSDRHTLLIVLTGSYFAVAALGRVGEKLAALLKRFRPSLAGTRWAAAPLWSAAVLTLAVASPLPRTLEQLHGDRVGFRTAGYWLAEHSLPGDFILDPYCWANYYAGRVFTEGRTDLKCHQPPLFYLVMEESDNKHTRLNEHKAGMEIKKHGTAIQRWQVRRGKDEAEVVVYEMKGPYTPQP
jgi:hypothetical protein